MQTIKIGTKVRLKSGTPLGFTSTHLFNSPDKTVRKYTEGFSFGEFCKLLGIMSYTVAFISRQGDILYNIGLTPTESYEKGKNNKIFLVASEDELIVEEGA